MTAKELAEKLLALPEEQQNAIVIYSFYGDPKDTMPYDIEVDEISFIENGWPTEIPHILMTGY